MGRTVTDPREAAAELAERFGRASSAVFFQGDEVVVVNRDPTPVDAGADLVCACDIAAAFGF